MPEQKTRSSRPCHLILLSAPTRDALEYMREDLVERLRRAPDLNPADVAFTLQVGRERFRHRLAAVCRDVEEAISVLENPGSKKVFFTTEERKTRGVVLVFGETAANGAPVGKELYAHETAFRDAVDSCAEYLKPRLETDIRERIFSGSEPPTELRSPLAFTIQYALARLWISRGVAPGGFTGRGVGELTAARLSGALSPERALDLSLAGKTGADASGSDADARGERAPEDARGKRAPEDALFLGIGGGAGGGAGALFRSTPGENGPSSRRDFVHHGKIDLRSLVYALGKLYCLGAPVDWSRFHAGATPYRVPLPGYPFARLRRSRGEIPGEIPGEGPDPGTTAPGDPAAEKQFSPRPDLENEYVAPRGEMEKTVAGIWENLLQIKPLGATDDLLTLGADSLLGMRFCSRVFETFGIEIQGARVFEAHRVADLAAIIEEARDAGNSERDVAGEILQKLDFIKDLSDSETDRLLTELADGGA